MMKRSRNAQSPCVLRLERGLGIALVLLIIVMTGHAFAQEATRTGIEGMILAQETEEPLSDATIEVVGTTRGTITGPDGRFRLSSLKPGTYQLRVRFVGYAPQIVTVKLESDRVAQVTVRLVTAPLETGGSMVTATRGQAGGDLPVAASLLQSREITTAPARTPDEVVRTIPAVTLPRADSRMLHPTGQSVSIRGLGSGRTLVLADGVPLNDPFGGWVQWNKVPKSQIERIEVVRGANSNLYGSLAMGGVIQMFTRPVTQKHLILEGDVGQANAPHVAFFAAQPVSPHINLGLSGDLYRTDGAFGVSATTRGPIDQPQGFDSHNLSTRMNLAISPRASAFVAGYYYKESRNSGTPLTDNHQWFLDGAWGVDIQTETGSRWQGRLFGGRQNLDNNNSRVNQSRSSEVPVLHQDVSVWNTGGSLVWWRPLGGKQALTLGLDLRQITGTNKERVLNAQGQPTGNRLAEGTQLLLGGFSEWSMTPVHPVTLTLGLRGDYWWNVHARSMSTIGQETVFANQRESAISPRLGIVFRPATAVAVRGAGYFGFRAPLLNELYRGFFAGSISFNPNPALKAEHLKGGEVGIDWTPRPPVQVKITGFYNHLSDLVQFITINAITRQRQNVATARSSGSELEVQYRPWRPLSVNASYVLTRSEIAEFPGRPELVGKWLIGIPCHQGVLAFQWVEPKLADITVRLRGETKRFDDDRNTTELPKFALLDLSFARRLWNTTEAFVSIANTLDKEVITSSQPGLQRIGTPRTVWGGLRTRLY